MGAVLLTDGEKVVPGQIDFSKGIAFGDPDDPLAFHTGDGCNVSNEIFLTKRELLRDSGP